MKNRKIWRTVALALVLSLTLTVATSCDLYAQLGDLADGNLQTFDPPADNPSPDTENPAPPDTENPPTPSTETPPAANETPTAPPSEDNSASNRTGYKAIDFTVYDRDGNPVRLSDYLGKPIVLNFWASWCGSCQREMPAFEEKYKELGDEVVFLMVNLTTGRETVDTATVFIEDNGYTFPVLYDTTSAAANAYSVISIPTTYFISADGYVMARTVGAVNASVLTKAISVIK